MKLRNLLATAGATALAATALAPVASAQTGIGIDLGIGKAVIENTNCDVFGVALDATGLVDEGMTRNELAAEIRGLDAGVDLGFLGFTLQSQYGGIVADKALECGIVEEDPETLFSASSDFLESLGLPGVPELQSLSSF